MTFTWLDRLIVRAAAALARRVDTVHRGVCLVHPTGQRGANESWAAHGPTVPVTRGDGQ